MSETSGIYAIENTLNGHRYVGSAVNTVKRWGAHRCLLRKGKHHSLHLQSAWRKYGEEAFQFTVLEKCEPEELVAAEQSWLDASPPEYNIARIAGSTLGTKRNETTRQRMSVAQKGHPVSLEQRARMAACNKGRKASAETLQKMSAAMKGNSWNKGKHLTPEHKANLSAAGMGHKMTAEAKAKVSAAKLGIRTGKPPYNKGKKLTPEHRASISSAKKGKPWSDARRKAWQRTQGEAGRCPT